MKEYADDEALISSTREGVHKHLHRFGVSIDNSEQQLERETLDAFFLREELPMTPICWEDNFVPKSQLLDENHDLVSNERSPMQE